MDNPSPEKLGVLSPFARQASGCFLGRPPGGAQDEPGLHLHRPAPGPGRAAGPAAGHRLRRTHRARGEEAPGTGSVHGGVVPARFLCFVLFFVCVCVVSSFFWGGAGGSPFLGGFRGKPEANRSHFGETSNFDLYELRSP